MTLNILFSARDELWHAYENPLRAAFQRAGIDGHLARKIAPEDVDYIVYAPNPSLTDFTPFVRTRAVLSLWAGVEGIVTNETLTMPLCRMANTGLSEGMVEWVTGHVLRHHLGMDRHITGQNGWVQNVPPLARQRRVGILGLGALGQSCACALAALNFQVTGWSRSPKQIETVTCHHGDDGLRAVLESSEILVTLLPLTAATDTLLNADRLAMLPQDAVVLNPGRGALIDDTALLDALDRGHLSHATLDVFRIEPLPDDHPFWAHPKVTVTPHIASETRPETAAQVIAENIRRAVNNEPLLHMVDRRDGY